ncbi:hypothetical protein PFUGPA_00231 [Plasmodium falciparum Palo Alto/Uganda]|uniref:Uncharacterized protein n=1 Tax=Plasmodium falciparum (isolate Palo Alto / Uganda) TaxID=57270 RepID=W4J825_PLAFP|nr:hypothetical protein PFUGPA_00231 [Plasmodium falciparum Palo Alto/Uganda]
MLPGEALTATHSVLNKYNKRCLKIFSIDILIYEH